jgi:hypothetical protein
MSVEEAVENVLTHYGTKGMKWGVRKDRDSASFRTNAQNLKPQGITMHKDGSVTIEKGANLQRISHANGKPFAIKELTYASINAYDTAAYIKELGGGKVKGLTLWGGSRDTILSIQATKTIKAPSIKEATRIHSDALVNDPKFRATALGNSNRRIEKIKADPTGKLAQRTYEVNNRRLILDEGMDSKAPAFRKEFVRVYQAKGYDAVRDELDAGLLSVAPVVIFHPEKSLKVVRTTQITKSLRKANNEELKLYNKRGKDWVERQLYEK